MAQFNQITLVGRLDKDPDMSYTNNGTAVTKFSMAVNRRKDGQGNERKPMWFNVVAWQKLAEIVNDYAVKGIEVLVQGQFDQRDYTDKNGVNRTTFEVIASTVQLLGSKQDRSKV